MDSARKPPPEPEFVIKGVKGGCVSAQFVQSPTEGTASLVVGGGDGQLVCYDLQTKKARLNTGVSTDAKGFHGVIACGGHNRGFWAHVRDEKVVLLDANAEVVDSLDVVNPGFCAACCHCDQTIILAIPLLAKQNVNVVQLCDITHQTFDNLATITVSSEAQKRGSIFSLLMVSATLVVAGFENGELATFDQSGTELCSRKLFDEAVLSLAHCRQTGALVCGSTKSPGRLMALESATDGCISPESRPFDYHREEAPAVGLASVTLRRDGRVFAGGFWDGVVRVYATRSTKLLALLDFHKESAVNVVSFSQLPGDCANMLVVGAKDGCMSFWNLYNK